LRQHLLRGDTGWAEDLDELDRTADAAEARRLVLERDPESEAARAIAAASSAA
jgi:hypothetical protein